MTHSPPPLVHSIVDAIGSTPLVELHQIVKKLGLQGRLLAKLEYFNPGSSKKDRIAREMILEARKNGSLAEGQTVVELTSGNTGTGLAIVCRALGHPFVAVMSRGNTIERARMMQALGAEVVLVDQAAGAVSGQVSGEDIARVEQRTAETVIQRNAFRADQFLLESNILAHERHTAPEIWEQSNHTINAFLDFAGSAGTFTGIARFLKSQNSAINCYVIEPATAAVLAKKSVTNSSHKIQGGGYNMTDLKLLDRSLVTDYLQVTNNEAIAASRMLAADEGIFAGFSAGANLASAIKLLQTSEKENSITFLIADSGLKYLSTDLFPPIKC